jgi:N-acetylmuramoyl-L-alanine amidase
VAYKFIFSFSLILLLGTACGARPEKAALSTATIEVETAALSATFPSPATDTPLPPIATLTAAPVEGTTSTQLNVRAEPSTASNVLGIIPANTRVQITGKDPAGNWLQILYPQGQDGRAWVTAQYVTTPNGTVVPVVGENPVDPDSGNTAVVQQQLNVRSGPGTGFNSLGTLNPKDVVRLTGRDPNGTWLQVEFPSGPEGKGWINAAFVQARGVENLSIVSEAGEAIGTGTPTGIPPTSTPTTIPAQADSDSQSHPIASVVFDPFGTHTLIYGGDVSTPEGDPEDWIQFTPYSDTVIISLECREKNDLQVSVLENGRLTDIELSCGERQKPIKVTPGSVYSIRLQASQFSGGLQYASYTVKIQSSP